MQVVEETKRKRGPKPNTTKLAIDADFCEKIKKLMAYGLSKEQVAKFYGITTVTLWSWSKQYPELFNALEAGRIEGLVSSSEALMKNVGKGCIASIKWYEQTRHNLSEKIKTESEITHKVETLEQALRRMKNVSPTESNSTPQITQEESSITDASVSDNIRPGTELVSGEPSGTDKT